MAPKMVKSKCPPLTIANEAAFENIEAPFFNVMVSFPALIKSAFSSPFFG